MSNGLTVMRQDALEDVQHGFLTLCQQYERMGILFQAEAGVLAKPKFSRTHVHKAFQKILNQYQEMGDQMKYVGDALYGAAGPIKPTPVSIPQPQPNSVTPPAASTQGMERMVFVSNIQPVLAGREEETDAREQK